jgi:hypothetical protein
MRSWIKVFNRWVVLLLVGSMPAAGMDVRVAALLTQLPTVACATLHPVEPRGTLTDIQHAHDLNLLFPDQRQQAINHSYYSTTQVLAHLDAQLPLIGCLAHQFGIAPELLAGIIALELDLDYHLTDTIGDQMVLSPLGEGLANIDIGAGYAQVHIKRLKQANQALGSGLLTTPFATRYRALIESAPSTDLTLFSTRHRELDFANAALMLRYYAQLRTNDDPRWLTLEDMAIIWSAYRGGVVGTQVDPDANHRWALINYQHANDTYLMGDTVIAVPYFRYFRLRFGGAPP